MRLEGTPSATRKLLPIDLSATGLRELIDFLPYPRDHVDRQLGSQYLFKSFVYHRTRVVSDVVTQQVRITIVVFSDHHDNIAYSWCLPGNRFDLPKLDPIPSQLDLRIDSTANFDMSIFESPAKITRLIEHATGLISKWVWNELRRSQVGLIKVTCGNSITCDPELPWNTDRKKLTVKINDVELSVRIGWPNTSFRPLRINISKVAAYRRLSRPINIPERAAMLQDCRFQIQQKRLTARHRHQAFMASPPAKAQHSQHGWSGYQDTHGTNCQTLDQKRWGLGKGLANYFYRRPANQGEEVLDNRNIEGRCSDRNQVVRCTNVMFLLGETEIIDQPTMANSNTFRSTGRARRIHHISQPIGARISWRSRGTRPSL